VPNKKQMEASFKGRKHQIEIKVKRKVKERTQARAEEAKGVWQMFLLPLTKTENKSYYRDDDSSGKRTQIL